MAIHTMPLYIVVRMLASIFSKVGDEEHNLVAQHAKWPGLLKIAQSEAA